MNEEQSKDLLAYWFRFDRIGKRKLADEQSLFPPEYTLDTLLKNRPEIIASILYLKGINDAILLARDLVDERLWNIIKTDLMRYGDLILDHKDRPTLSVKARRAIIEVIDKTTLDKHVEETFRIFIEIAMQASQVLRSRQAILGRRFFIVESANLIFILAKCIELKNYKLLVKLALVIADVIIETGIFQENDSQISNIINIIKEYPSFKHELELLYVKMALIYERKGDFNKALSFHQESLLINESLQDYSRAARRQVDIGNIYSHMNQADKALEYFDLGLITHRKAHSPDLKGIAYAFRQKGRLYLKEGDIKNSEDCFRNDLEIARQLEDRKAMIGALTNLADLLKKQNLPLKALELYQRALEIAKSLEDLPTIAGCMLDIGELYIALGRAKDSLIPLQESVKVSRDVGDFYSLAVSLRTLARAYERLNMWEDAINSFRESMRFGEKVGIENIVSISMRELGQLYVKKGDFKEAVPMLNNALVRFEKRADTHNLQKCRIELGRAFLANKDFVRAEGQFLKAIKISKENNHRTDLPKAMDFLARTYMEEKKYKDAFNILYEALEIESGKENPQYALSALYMMGELFLNSSEPEKAIQTFDEIMKLTAKTGKPKETANIYYKLGISYLKAKKHQDAALFFLKASNIYSELGWKRKVQMIDIKVKRIKHILGESKFNDIDERLKSDKDFYFVLTHKAAEFEFMRDYEHACEYYQKALDYLHSHKAEEDWHRKFNDAHLMYGTALKKAHRWQESIQVQKEAFNLYSSEGKYSGMARAYFEIGNVYHIMNDFEQARLYYKDAYRLFKRSHRETESPQDLYMSALVKESLGLLEFYLFMFDEAKEDLVLSSKIFAQLGSDENEKRAQRIIHLINSFEKRKPDEHSTFMEEVS